MPDQQRPLATREPVAEFRLLGRVPFDAFLALQSRLVYEAGGLAEPRIVVLLCEHPDLITVGRAGSRGHIRFSNDQLKHEQLGVRWISRGGGCVLHAPGQLAVYPIVPLSLLGLDRGRVPAAIAAGDCRRFCRIERTRRDGRRKLRRLGAIRAAGQRGRGGAQRDRLSRRVHQCQSRHAAIRVCGRLSAASGPGQRKIGHGLPPGRTTSDR